MSVGPAFALAFLVMAITAPTAARAYCSEPSAPYCASKFGSFEDEDEFDRCRREMTNYQSEVESFSQCQGNVVDTTRNTIRDAQSEAEKAVKENNEAVAAYNEAVETFSRRARGY